MSNKLYIEIIFPCEFYGKYYLQKEQFDYVDRVLRTVDHKPNPNGAAEYYNIGVDCDGNEVIIPDEYSVITDICVPFKSFQQKLRDRVMDKTKNYMEKVKDVLDIDMSKNNRIQVNRSYYEKLDLKVDGDLDEKINISEHRG